MINDLPRRSFWDNIMENLNIIYKYGRFSSLAIGTLFVLYTVLFVGIMAAYPIPKFVDVPTLALGMDQTWYTLYTICQALMLLASPLFFVVFSALHEKAQPQKKFYARLALGFGTMFSVLSTTFYFTQLTQIPKSIERGAMIGLENFVQLNPSGFSTSFNLLAWTLFLGLASLFASCLFGEGKTDKRIRNLFIANGVLCLLGAIGYGFGIMALNILFFNGMGLCVMLLAFYLAKHFKAGKRVQNAE